MVGNGNQLLTQEYPLQNKWCLTSAKKSGCQDSAFLLSSGLAFFLRPFRLKSYGGSCNRVPETRSSLASEGSSRKLTVRFSSVDWESGTHSSFRLE